MAAPIARWANFSSYSAIGSHSIFFLCALCALGGSVQVIDCVGLGARRSFKTNRGIYHEGHQEHKEMHERPVSVYDPSCASGIEGRHVEDDQRFSFVLFVPFAVHSDASPFPLSGGRMQSQLVHLER